MSGNGLSGDYSCQGFTDGIPGKSDALGQKTEFLENCRGGYQRDLGPFSANPNAGTIRQTVLTAVRKHYAAS